MQHRLELLTSSVEQLNVSTGKGPCNIPVYTSDTENRETAVQVSAFSGLKGPPDPHAGSKFS